MVKMFTKMLVANRGEIAVRVIRACRDMGISTVAVYAEPDESALFVRLADEAFPLSDASAANTYLNIERVVAAGLAANADCVHPGYGFLAESAAFARAVEAAGMTWIGPPPEVIEVLGDKSTAREVAVRVGAPIAAGTPGVVNSSDEIARFATSVGYPVAIKAAHGGGGRGIKVVHAAGEVEAAFDSAVREATMAFGRGECFAEKYLEAPRHVETQCLADAHGNVIVVSTRDCSLQRRHQKLVEEAPAPFLSADQDSVLRAASKKILREVGYVGAGTCEFLLGQDGTIAFLEVNTRLQVEHCASEEVTGWDIVKKMIQIAAGAALEPEDPPVRGHAIEFRINAEDPTRSFQPSPGRLDVWAPPSGPGVRIDHGYEQGDTIPGLYDSMIAKVIVTGDSREEAVARSRRALRELQVTGVATVVPFHRAVLDHPDFLGKDDGLGVHTTWIETGPLDPTALEPYLPTMPTQIASSLQEASTGDQPTLAVGMRHPGLVVTRGPRPNSPSVEGTSSIATAGRVRSTMQGTVVKVPVTDGAEVQTGDVLVVVESMKMEQPFLADRPGRISNLSVAVGSAIGVDAVICDIVE